MQTGQRLRDAERFLRLLQPAIQPQHGRTGGKGMEAKEWRLRIRSLGHHPFAAPWWMHRGMGHRSFLHPGWQFVAVLPHPNPLPLGEGWGEGERVRYARTATRAGSRVPQVSAPASLDGVLPHAPIAGARTPRNSQPRTAAVPGGGPRARPAAGFQSPSRRSARNDSPPFAKPPP